MPNDKLNGSVERLAVAMRDVFTEAVENAVEPLRSEMRDMEDRLNKRIDATNKNMRDMEDRLNKRIDTTNQNTQAQFAHQEAVIGKMLKGEHALAR
jgi:uncharacterized protein YPO0396